MIKTLYGMSVLALSSAGILLVLSVSQGLPAAGPQDSPGPAAVERFSALHDAVGRNAQETAVPLLREAETFALYLNPPAPPATPATPQVIPRSQAVAPRALCQPPQVTPWFRLLATSYNRRHPEQSWALISEPGRKDRWVTGGEPLGRFVLESVGERGNIVYRDGSRSREMRIAVREAGAVARLPPDVPVSAQDFPPGGRLVNVSPPSEGGVGTPDIEALAQELR
jgi:hypothetical protein